MTDTYIRTSRAQLSRAAIHRLYIAMRHLFIRGSYKPLGVSGEAIKDALLELEPEIYGSIADPERAEISGLLYIFQRLPQGIEECRFIRLISREGYETSKFKAILPAKRRRNCYRIDDLQMYIEMSRGGSDIYDVLTHLTFMYIEAEKIRNHALDHRGRKRREWNNLEDIVKKIKAQKKFNKELGITHLSTLLGRTYEETASAVKVFDNASKVNSLFNIVYWLGNHSIEEELNNLDREISFSSTLRDKLGRHIFGTIWAQNIKSHLQDLGLLDRQIHIVSANMHSVKNSLYATAALQAKSKKPNFEKLTEALSKESNKAKNLKVRDHALKNGMTEIPDTSGANIAVQIIDLSRINSNLLPKELKEVADKKSNQKKVIIVMDYAFGEQAFECMDELLKPYDSDENTKVYMDVKSVNIMGKAGILEGKKGDIMIPTAHVFEGSADNYSFINSLSAKDFKDKGIDTYTGPMITVLGTSLQNKDILRYFLKSSWKAIGLEMEGAHYQKAIQAASKIRNSIKKKVVIRYAYYASDNPLESGSTLASGGLGIGGVKPTYEITKAILRGILS